MAREESKSGNGIKILCLDVDGTLTDGKIYMGNEGELFKAFHVKDGCGIHDILIPFGIRPIIITGRTSMILDRRCKELGITELFQEVEDKGFQLDEILKKEGIDYSEVAYMGDDINDLSCMRKIKEHMGVIGCPADAAKIIIDIADFVSIHKGGEGAVREFIDWLVECERNKSLDKDTKCLPVLYHNRENCCGCSACYAICSSKAIRMEPDDEGFLYPTVYADKCIGCNLCLSVCAFKIAQKEKLYIVS